MPSTAEKRTQLTHRRWEPVLSALESGWPEYLMEAGCLGLFLAAACLATVWLEHPDSAVHRALPEAWMRMAAAGAAMGLTLLGIVHSPWGKQSGAHMNPALTLTYFWLGKLDGAQALFYVLAQFAGGIAGVAAALWIAGPRLAHASVNYAVTRPGPAGVAVAFAAEGAISFLMMGVILVTTNSRRLHRWTPYVAAALLAAFITFEAPLSGMSMNPARTFGSALAAREWTAIWVYFSAPPAGMLLAGCAYRMAPGARRVYCAKLHHHNGTRCRFHCNYGDMHGGSNPV